MRICFSMDRLYDIMVNVSRDQRLKKDFWETKDGGGVNGNYIHLLPGPVWNDKKKIIEKSSKITN